MKNIIQKAIDAIESQKYDRALGLLEAAMDMPEAIAPVVYPAQVNPRNDVVINRQFDDENPQPPVVRKKIIPPAIASLMTPPASQ